MVRMRSLLMIGHVCALLVLSLFLPASGHAFVDIAGALDSPVDSDGTTPLVFLSSSSTGTADWFVSSLTPTTGDLYSAQSGTIMDGEYSSLTATVTGPGSLSFYQKISSQPTYDTLTFFLKGSIKSTISGTVNWQQKIFTLPTGTSTLVWKYAKNANTSKGSDAAWLDKVVVSPNTALKVVYPNGGENLISGSTATIIWNAPAAAEKYDLYYTTNNGASWNSIAKNQIIPNFTGIEYPWFVPVPASGNKTACRVKVVAKNAANAVVGADVSDKPFVIQVLKVTSPNGGESLNAKTTPTFPISFTISGQQNAASAAISYTMDNGTSWHVITTLGALSPGDYTYSGWNVPAVAALKTACKVKVVLKNKAGTVLAADASNANFTIQPLLAISGVVSWNGVRLTDVTMTLGGGDSGTAKTDGYGRYSFKGLPNGNYTITPSFTGLEFTPASASKTLSNTNISGVNFSAAIPKSGWSSQVRIGFLRNLTDGYHLYSPHVKLNDSNVGFAVWEENSGTISHVWANRFAGGSWGSIVQVSAGLSGSSDPRVAVDADGNATAVWIEKGFDQNGNPVASNTVWASRYAASSGTWSAPARISNAPTADFTFYAFLPAVTVDSLGQVVAVWEQDDPATAARSIWTSRYDGSSWSAPYLLSNGTKHCEDPRVAVDGNNNVFSIWTQNTNTYDPGQPAAYNAVTNTWAAIYSSASDTWGASDLIGDPTVTTGLTERARIAVNTGGTAVVAWEQTQNGVPSITSNRYDPNAWLTPVSLATGTQFVAWPAVAMDSGGNAFTAWTQYDGTNPHDGWMSRYDANEGWSPPALFESADDDVNELAIDVDGSGNAIMAWAVSTGGIKASRYTPASGWGAAAAIGAGDQLDMDVNSGGEALVISIQMVWDPLRGFYYAPFAARYHPSP